MEVEITLHGGPLDKHAMSVEVIHDLQLFVDPASRIVVAYRRYEDALGYVYDAKASLGLTENYDKVSERVGPKIRMYPLRRIEHGGHHTENAPSSGADGIPKDGALP